MPSQKLHFTNAAGEKLSAKLELPANQHPHTFALFAHCFTCNKNLTAIKNISRALNLQGIAVLRFDFTGLGESEGDFADTNFSSNIEDLVCAAEYLGEHFQAPELLIGHSLGGAAVIAAATELPAVKAVVTIGAPADPAHVSHLVASGMEALENEGVAEVNIGGRPFTIKKQFVEDIKSRNLNDKLDHFNGRALLIMHSPQDRTVEIDNAAKLYTAARHPKSFVTLDGADHLLTNKADSHYVGEVVATWAKRYITLPDQNSIDSDSSVAVQLAASDGYTTQVMVRQHGLTADEPTSVGGNDFGPSPYELVTAGLGTCTAMTLHMYARRKQWDLQDVKIHLEHGKDYAADCENCEDPKSKIDHFQRVIELEGNLDEQQRQRLLEIADKCPVHRTLEGEVRIHTELRRE